MKTAQKRLEWILFLLYLCVLLRITVFRAGCFSHGFCSGRVEWIPFVYLAELVRKGNWGYFCYLFGGNLIWFVPLGLWLRRQGRSLVRALLTGAGLSLCIEMTQYLLGSGVSEMEDLILNTLGALAGYELGRFLFRKG